LLPARHTSNAELNDDDNDQSLKLALGQPWV